MVLRAVHSLVITLLSCAALACPARALPSVPPGSASRPGAFTPERVAEARQGSAATTASPDPAITPMPHPVPPDVTQARPDASSPTRDGPTSGRAEGDPTPASPPRGRPDAGAAPAGATPEITSQPGTGPAAEPPGAAGPSGASTPPLAPALPLPPNTAKLAVSGVLGRTVVGPDKQQIGRVVDVLVDGSGEPRAGVIDFGGFMGLGSRKIAVEWGAFTFPPSGSDAELTIALTPEEIKNTPEYAGPGKPVSVVGPGTPAPGHGP